MVGELHASDEPTDSEWGNPSSVMGRDHSAEGVGGTGGTETSKYPEEAESTAAACKSGCRSQGGSSVGGEARSSGERTGLAPKPGSLL